MMHPPLISAGLSGGVRVAQGSLEALVMVRIHAGQPLNSLFFREQVLQIVLGKTLRKAFLTEHVRNGLCFGLL